MASVFAIMNCSLIIVTRKPGSQAKVVTATITMLYLLSIAQLAIAYNQILWTVERHTKQYSLQLSSAQYGPNLHRQALML